MEVTMVKFVEIDPADVPNLRQGRRGRVSYPILKGFLEQNKPVMMLDRTGMQNPFQSLYATLRYYAEAHDMPVEIFSRAGELYLARTDMDDEGNVIEQEDEGASGSSASGESVAVSNEARPINAEEVERRFEEEKGQTTK
jgi:hypothetical protein